MPEVEAAEKETQCEEEACLGHDGLVHHLVRLIVHALAQGHVDRVVSTLGIPRVVLRPCSWEEVSVVVEANLHSGVNIVTILVSWSCQNVLADTAEI